MGAIPSTDGPPPSPATDPAAAKEAGQVPPMGPAGLAAPMQMPQQGPDLSGVLTLFKKLEEGLLTLAQAVPMVAPDLEQARAIMMNAAGRFASQASPAGGSSSMPGAGATGTVVSQSGSQFPGSAGPKPF